MDVIMPKGREVWRAIVPSLFVLTSWGFTGIHWLYPAACAALGFCVLAITFIWPRIAWFGGLHLALFALAAWSQLSLPKLLLSLMLPLVVWFFLKGPSRPFMLAMIVALPIAGLSGGTGSATGWQESLMAMFHLTFSQADFAVICIRRTIHFSAYGLIALTFYRTAVELTVRRHVAVAALWVIGHAAFDELRQLMTPGRSGRLEDFLIDMAGAVTFISIYYLRQRDR